MSSVTSLGLLALGLVLVVGGAELFFKGLLASAPRLGVSPFVLTVVISGFELENLAAGIAANAKGLPDAAAGTFLGGTTFLALGVTGLASLVSPVRAELPRAVSAWTATAPFPLFVFSLDGVLSRLDGALLLSWFVVALVGIVRSGRSLLEAVDVAPKRHPVARLVAGLALLTAGGEALGEGIRGVVDRFRVSESLLGNTAIAASVEAEEVARVAAPARRARGDVAMANVVGTIVHFVALNAGLIALVRPLELGDESRLFHLPAALAATVLLALLVAWRRGVGRVAGALLLALYAAYVAGAVLVALAA